MKHINIKNYLEAAAASEEAWDLATDKLEELELKIKELTIIKAQIKVLLDNVSMSSTHLRSLVMDLERYYACFCGKLESHPNHSGEGSMIHGNHAFVNAHEFKRENE